MALAKRGARWTVSEEDQLLLELRGPAGIEEIARSHQRTEGAIQARTARLVSAARVFEVDADAFEWARAELRKGSDGLLAQVADRVDGVSAPVENHERSARLAEVVALWSDLTGLPHDRFGRAAERHVLAEHADEVLSAAGRRLLDARRPLTPAEWLVECDHPGAGDLRLTAEQVRAGGEDVALTGGELLVAGLAKLRKGRHREMLTRRLGLAGDDDTTFRAIGAAVNRSGTTVRNLCARGITRLVVRSGSKVRRSWHHVNEVLSSALAADDGGLDPRLVLAFTELAAPSASPPDAVHCVAALCGLLRQEREALLRAVVEVREERDQCEEQKLRAELLTGKLDRRLAALLDKVDWPDREPQDGRPLGPLRTPNEDGYGNAGRWRSDELGRDVGYESHAELGMIRLIDFSRLVRSYCEQPLAIPYRLAGRDRLYYPDLFVELRDGRCLVVEVKASQATFAEHVNIVKFAAAEEYCRNRGWGFLAVAQDRTPRDLTRRTVPAAWEAAVRDRLRQGTLDYRSYGEFALPDGMRFADVAALILRNGWYYRSSQFRLSLEPPETAS